MGWWFASRSGPFASEISHVVTSELSKQAHKFRKGNKRQIQNFQGSWLRSELKHEKNSSTGSKAFLNLWAYKETSLKLSSSLKTSLSDNPHVAKDEAGTSLSQGMQGSSWKMIPGTFLVVQWVRVCAPNAGGPGSIPGLGTRSHLPQRRSCTPQLRVCMPQLQKIPHATTTKDPTCHNEDPTCHN